MIHGKLRYLRSFLALAAIAGAGSVQGGDLNPPPGPIGPTMKRLDVVEPRTPVSALPYTIAEPGSYYLTGNLTGTAGENGISIAASDVTIDLMGFTLQGAPGSLDGVGMTMLPIAFDKISIRDGTIRDWGGNGIMAAGSRHGDPRRLVVRNNGGHGAVLGDYAHLEEVSFASNGGMGAEIGSYGHMEEVSFSYNTGVGAQIGAFTHMEDVSFTYNGGGGAIVGAGVEMEEVSFCYNGGNGLEADDTCIITRCTIERNTLDGLVGGESISIRDTVVADNGGRGVVLVRHDTRGPAVLSGIRATGNGGDGIVVGENATLNGCAAIDNGGRGIVADKASPKLAECHAVGNTGGDGIVLGANGTCTGCTARSNSGIGINGTDKASPKLFGCHSEGNSGDGIVLGDNASCEKCTSTGNSGRGIVMDKASPKLAECHAVGNTGGDGIVLGENATCTGCTANNNSGRGIVADKSSPKLAESHAVGNGGNGIVLGTGGVAHNATARNNGGIGIAVVDDNAPAKTAGCIVEGNGLDGIKVGSGSIVTDCTARGNGTAGDGAGIRVAGAGSRIEGNHLLNNDWGISLFTGGNLVIRNSASGNTTANYDIPVGNAAGPIVASSDVDTDASPNANYDY